MQFKSCSIHLINLLNLTFWTTAFHTSVFPFHSHPWLHSSGRRKWMWAPFRCCSLYLVPTSWGSWLHQQPLTAVHTAAQYQGMLQTTEQSLRSNLSIYTELCLHQLHDKHYTVSIQLGGFCSPITRKASCKSWVTLQAFLLFSPLRRGIISGLERRPGG